MLQKKVSRKFNFVNDSNPSAFLLSSETSAGIKIKSKRHNTLSAERVKASFFP